MEATSTTLMYWLRVDVCPCCQSVSIWWVLKNSFLFSFIIVSAWKDFVSITSYILRQCFIDTPFTSCWSACISPLVRFLASTPESQEEFFVCFVLTITPDKTINWFDSFAGTADEDRALYEGVRNDGLQRCMKPLMARQEILYEKRRTAIDDEKHQLTAEINNITTRLEHLK